MFPLSSTLATLSLLEVQTIFLLTAVDGFIFASIFVFSPTKILTFVLSNIISETTSFFSLSP